MNLLSRLKAQLESEMDFKDVSEKRDAGNPAGENFRGESEKRGEAGFQVENEPIEPKGKKLGRPSLFKWILFLFLVAYVLITYYHAPFLTYLGRYLVVEHPITEADLIVCLMGKPVERGLTTADLYRQGLASYIFVGREKPPDGNSELVKRGVHFPEERDLLLMMLTGLGIPRSACITGDGFIEGTLGEAKVVREMVRKRGFKSLIIVTSPTHTRRSWLIYRNLLEKDDTKIIMVPSGYSNFKAEKWWKTREYVREVVIEYQKLLYYIFKYF